MSHNNSGQKRFRRTGIFTFCRLPARSVLPVYIYDATRKESVKEVRFNRDDAAIFFAFARNYDGGIWWKEVAMKKRNTGRERLSKNIGKRREKLPRVHILRGLNLLMIYRYCWTFNVQFTLQNKYWITEIFALCIIIIFQKVTHYDDSTA